MLQPYLASVDRDGETALLYFGGHFSHAARKRAQLAPGEGARQPPMALGAIAATTATPAEQALADRILAATARLRQLDAALPYARIDLLTGADGKPCLLELELTEPSLFFAQAEGSAQRFARVLADHLAGATVPARMAPA